MIYLLYSTLYSIYLFILLIFLSFTSAKLIKFYSKISWAKTLYFDFTNPLGCFAKTPPSRTALSKDLQLTVQLKLRSGIFPVRSRRVNRRSLSLEFQCERSVQL